MLLFNNLSMEMLIKPYSKKIENAESIHFLVS